MNIYKIIGIKIHKVQPKGTRLISLTSILFLQQRTGESQGSGCTQREGSEGGAGSGASDASGDSGSGSEGDEVEFVPSSWDCRAAPAKSSLRSLEQATPVGSSLTK